MKFRESLLLKPDEEIKLTKVKICRTTQELYDNKKYFLKYFLVLTPDLPFPRNESLRLKSVYL